PTAWADVDNDGDLDLFVGFRGRPNRLYRNDAGTFVDVAAAAGFLLSRAAGQITGQTIHVDGGLLLP
ncbi:MAG: SDR family oxidoreductase, partial [Bauldia sp.]